MKKQSTLKKHLPWIIVLLIAAAITSFLVIEGKKPGQYDALAQCLTKNNAKFYGAWWCSHCQAQKRAFGKSASYLPYIECQTQQSKQKQICIDAEIKGFPTWVFADGSRLTGEIPLETLASKTNCPLN